MTVETTYGPDPPEGEWHAHEVTTRMLILYFVLTFILTWSFIIPAMSWTTDPVQTLLIIIGAFGPFLAAVIAVWTHRGSAELKQWLGDVFTLRTSVLLYVTGAFLLPLTVGGLHYGLYRALGGRPAWAEATPWYQYLAHLIPTALLTGGNEEPGWRGFALPGLLARVNPVWASLILGVVHGVWHLPMMRHYDTNLGWYLFNIVPLTFVFNWLYLVSRKRIIPVMLFHAGTNVISSFIPTPDNVLGAAATWMVLRGTVYWAMAVALVLGTRGRLGYRPAPENKGDAQLRVVEAT